uniref:Uncharacterized protein n=1 Tax=Arion vulgaris TaxID=1028688 RepID=A0A0B7AKJ3_9EUPU
MEQCVPARHVVRDDYGGLVVRLANPPRRKNKPTSSTNMESRTIRNEDRPKALQDKHCFITRRERGIMEGLDNQLRA